MEVTAYASLNSLMQVLDHIQERALSGLVQVDTDQIGTLQEQVTFLLEFLETYSHEKSEDIEDLTTQMADIAIITEDIIDLHVVDQLCRSFYEDVESVSFFHDVEFVSFFPDIEKVIEKINSIKEKLMLVKEECLIQELHELKVSFVPTSSSRIPVSTKNVDKQNTIVGFDDHLLRIMDQLTGHRSSLQIISIVGMGGIGKTTLARNVFDHPCVVQSFDKLHWVTLSQQYSVGEILLSLLNDSTSKASSEDLAKLGELLYKSLCGSKYLIVMDDVWSTDAWDDLRSFFPNNNNGSRIMLTTRLSSVAISLASHNPYLMDFLDEDKSWDLFCEKVFQQKSCPLDLEETGKEIAKSCQGLPLAIVVIGGLLANCEMTRKYWDFVANNVNSFVNENDEHCLNILGLSYKHLPIHLKPCLLYMGVFPEDEEVRVSKLIKLWIAQGFVKPVRAKTLEEVAKGYLNDLIGRNLILKREGNHTGKVKTCGIHDLLRDLCIRESRKEQLFSVPKIQHVYRISDRHNCFLCSHPSQQERISFCEFILCSQLTSPASLLVCSTCTNRYPRLKRSRLVLLCETFRNPYFELSMQPTTLRYYSLTSWSTWLSPSFIALLWNLQTLCIHKGSIVLPSEIWEMPNLRHLLVESDTALPDFAQNEGKGFTVLKTYRHFPV